MKLHNQKAKLKAIYFSASTKTLEAVLPELEPLWKTEFDGLIRIITRQDLLEDVKNNGCIGVPTEDAIETAEMELCYRASAFIRYLKRWKLKLEPFSKGTVFYMEPYDRL